MDSFRKGRVKVLVATDIAARGIDVSQVSHVINFDLPDTADAYTHRTGRTGRMERLGTALSLVTQEDLPMLRTIERLMGRTLERRSILFSPQLNRATKALLKIC
jgi:ATP-dependent RNA helicase RhlE